ncbi:MAG: hypothetical protein V7606_567 [Burkholderiales bacterium]
MFSSSYVAAKYPVGSGLATALLCVLLTACGGGGDAGAGQGSGNTQSESPPPVVGGVGITTETVATQARFNVPRGLAIDADGNTYVVDSGNSTIRKITPAGTVTTIAGTPGATGSSDGAGAAARFNSPSNIAVDAARNLYVADTGNHTVRKITPAGVVTTLAGTVATRGDADGVGASAQFNQPWGIAADAAGNVYVADTGNSLVRKITPAGAVSTLAGTRGQRGTTDGDRASATLLGPRGLAIDGAGNLFITDWYGPPAPAFAETSTFVRKITQSGAVSTIAGTMGNGPVLPTFRDTWTIATDGAGNTYVTAQNSIRKVTAAGAVTTVAEGSQFESLLGVAIDTGGNIFVSDESRHFIARVTQGGEVRIVAGKSGETGSANASQ